MKKETGIKIGIITFATAALIACAAFAPFESDAANITDSTAVEVITETETVNETETTQPQTKPEITAETETETEIQEETIAENSETQEAAEIIAEEADETEIIEENTEEYVDIIEETPAVEEYIEEETYNEETAYYEEPETEAYQTSSSLFYTSWGTFEYISPETFRGFGSFSWNGFNWTYYSENVLPGGGLNIPGRYSDENFVRDCYGNICLASSDLSYGTIIQTPWGQGCVYDCGCEPGDIDVYVSW